jgi:hypothetical protein
MPDVAVNPAAVYDTLPRPTGQGVVVLVVFVPSVPLVTIVLSYSPGSSGATAVEFRLVLPAGAVDAACVCFSVRAEDQAHVGLFQTQSF